MGQGITFQLMEEGLLPQVKVIFESLAVALTAETPEEQRRLFEPVHRGLVIFDDYLCARFSFSRRPRGKYANMSKKEKE